MIDFKDARTVIQNHFNEMVKDSVRLFNTLIDKDKIYQLYLDSFSPEANPVFKTRREYDCNICRHFIQKFGGMVSIKNGKLDTLWNVTTGDKEFDNVFKELDKYVRGCKVHDVLLISKNDQFGVDHNLSHDENGHVSSYNHFYLKTPQICKSNDTESEKSEYRSGKDVFKRALDTISIEAIETVLELIDSNTLYRGTENRWSIDALRRVKIEYLKLTSEYDKDLYAWEKSVEAGPTLSRIRNTAIGTLLIDISEGKDLDVAVTSYEKITAPSNYKRPKAIYIEKMLEDAKKQIQELGYLDSLPRRYATLEDITINNVLFANREVKQNNFKLTESESFFEDMKSSIGINTKKFSKAENISINDFVEKVLPKAKDIEVLFEGKLTKNLVSLISPKNKTAKSLFKWKNGFSWAYTGNMADSALKQNVKNAGGNVEGDLRFSIQWNDIPGEYDGNDEDAHCVEPTGYHIYFGNKVNRIDGGNLDIDIISPRQNMPAVENITWPSRSRMKPGTYHFFVNCYNNRGGKTGFRAEIEFDGQIYSFNYNRPLRQNEDVSVADVTLDTNGNFTIKELLNSSMSTKEIWGLTTNQFVPVSVILYSPNYWDDEIGTGAKHVFFMLKNCVNDENPNAFYNEFLNDDFKDYRRVMEALGSKAHVEFTENQLSGLGFSLTQHNEITVKVKSENIDRILKVTF